MYLGKTFLAFMLLAFVSAPAFGKGKQLILGLISDKPAGRIKEYSPLAEYVARRLERFDIAGGKVVIAKNTDQMLKKIRNREVDIVFETAFSTIEMSEKAGMKPELLVWKKGQREYTSVIFVGKESRLQELSDLKGKTIVFEDPKSTSAYLLPKTDLIKNGLTVLPIEERGNAGALKYMFGGEETNIAFFVIQKRADAGAFSSDDWNELPGKVKGELRVIHETKPVLRFIASFHPDLPEDLREAIAGVFKDMPSTPDGKKVLKRAAGTEKIEPLSNRDYESLHYVRELMRHEAGY